MVRSVLVAIIVVFSTISVYSTASLDEVLQLKQLDSLLDSPTTFLNFIKTTCSQCTVDSITKNSIKTYSFTDKATSSSMVFTLNGTTISSISREVKFRQSNGEQFFETIKDMLEDSGWSTTVANLERSQQEFTKTIGTKKITIELKVSEVKSSKKNTPKQYVATWQLSWVQSKATPIVEKQQETSIAPKVSKYLIETSQISPCSLPNKLRWNITFNELEVLLKTNKLSVDTIFKGSGPLVGYGNIISSTVEDKQEVQYTFNFQELSLRSITKSIEYDDINQSKKAFTKLFSQLETNGWSVLEYTNNELRAMFVNQCFPMNNVFSAVTIGLSPIDSTSIYITLEQMGTSDIAAFPQMKQRIIDIEKEQSYQPCSSPHQGLLWGSDSIKVQTWLLENGYRIQLPIASRKSVSTFRYTFEDNTMVNYTIAIRGNDFYRWQKERRFDTKANAQMLFKILVDDAKGKYKQIETTDNARYIFKQQCATRSFIYTLYKKNDSTIVQEMKSISPEIQQQELADYQRLLYATRYFCELPSACTIPFDINKNATITEVENAILYYGFTKAPVTGEFSDTKGVKTIPFYYGNTSNEQLIVSFSNAKVVQFEIRANFINKEDFDKYTSSINQQLKDNFSVKDIVSTNSELTLVKPTCDVVPSELEISSDAKKRQFRWVLKLL
ncbi:MAG: hypothetical protein JNL36_12195 [Candidatus Kapabacteria bacterium]|nr:hypothetical protein [Candidatus Kapabacteria bacterium]